MSLVNVFAGKDLDPLCWILFTEFGIVAIGGREIGNQTLVDSIIRERSGLSHGFVGVKNLRTEAQLLCKVPYCIKTDICRP